ncbi:TetR/AcrR family transcriptional regulator [Anaeromicropila populeti]|uniref:Transcriptional regulator, TetR family n=1 Tax=Anaeromicropila populeti TaxID=37658 RepID=A0A1I6LCP0_9FIRM|nr:TetR/AcrR family transcriptional regulator [Anaeromicropila populeti]SFS01058.1 transcriptional regulator, TetR family [Anaeromicropila populeti]
MDNREKILECALQLFYQRGYDAVSIQEIVNHAGITKPTLYYYFKSKYGLLESILEYKCRPFNDRIRNSSLYSADLTVSLCEITKIYLSTATEEKEFFFFMLALFYSAKENESHKAIHPYLTEQFQLLSGVFERFTPQLGNMRGRQEQFAMGFLGIINLYITVLIEKNNLNKAITQEQVAYSLVHQFMHGIFS